MGLLNKLKNVLFEEEEIEETLTEKQQDNTMNIPKITMDLPKINKEPKKENLNMNYNGEEESERELFKVERTFDFPAFDEDEFEDFSTIAKDESKKVNDFEINESKSISSKIPKKKDYTSTRLVKPLVEEKEKKTFKPSPVISPVYGILDKNYKKEDILTKEESNIQKNVKLDVDSVRKKAFGTLEEDLASTLAEPIDDFYEESVSEILEEDLNKENLDELLDKTVDVEIDVTKEMELPSRLNKENYNNVEDEGTLETPETEETSDILEISKMENDKEKITDDTLENDLFELIDSMYENGDDEE